MILDEQIQRAMWAGDTDWLNEHFGCVCCCDEHTFESCPARRWNGCRGNGEDSQAEYESWKRHYMKLHGMTEEQFEGSAL